MMLRYLSNVRRPVDLGRDVCGGRSDIEKVRDYEGPPWWPYIEITSLIGAAFKALLTSTAAQVVNGVHLCLPILH